MLMEHPHISQKQYVSRPAFVHAQKKVVNIRLVLHNYPFSVRGGARNYRTLWDKRGGAVSQRTATATCQSSNQLPGHTSYTKGRLST